MACTSKRVLTGIFAFSNAVSMRKDDCGSGMKMSMSLFVVTSPLAMLPCATVWRWKFSSAVIICAAFFRYSRSKVQRALL